MEPEKMTVEEQLREAQSRVDTLLSHESNLVWTRYNVFLVANSMSIAAAGVLVDQPIPCFVQITLCICGLFTCALWYLLTVRGFANCGSYYSLSFEMEAQRFLKQHQIHARITEMTNTGRLVHFDKLAMLSILVFAVPNLVLLALNFM
ncbi:MAG: hypothetical protein R3C18_19720 [Planctomycetaceae bacterium]